MIPVQNLYYLLCYAWDEVAELESAEARELGAFSRLQDLFGWVLARSVLRLARRGLDRSCAVGSGLVAAEREHRREHSE